MSDKPLTDSEIASVVAQGGFVCEFDLDNKLTKNKAPPKQTCCLVPRILECGDLPERTCDSTESRPAHEAYLGATLAQGVAEALLTPRVICRTCRCIERGSAYSVHIQSKVLDGKILGAVMVCRPADASSAA